MGLFNRGKEEKPKALDLNYSVEALEKQIRDLARPLHEYRNDTPSKVFVSYIFRLMNLEILKMSTGRELTGEAYAYRRGRVDALRELLSTREAYISHEENAKSKDKQTDHKAKRTYFKRPKPSTAGLSI